MFKNNVKVKYFVNSWQLSFGVLRVLNIIISVLFIAMLILNSTVINSDIIFKGKVIMTPDIFNLITIILGCIVGVLNIVNTIVGYNTAAKGKMDAWQLSWFNRLHPGD